jgi:hypothetical protein
VERKAFIFISNCSLGVLTPCIIFFNNRMWNQDSQTVLIKTLVLYFKKVKEPPTLKFSYLFLSLMSVFGKTWVRLLNFIYLHHCWTYSLRSNHLYSNIGFPKILEIYAKTIYRSHCQFAKILIWKIIIFLTIK